MNSVQFNPPHITRLKSLEKQATPRLKFSGENETPSDDKKPESSTLPENTPKAPLPEPKMTRAKKLFAEGWGLLSEGVKDIVTTVKTALNEPEKGNPPKTNAPQTGLSPEQASQLSQLFTAVKSGQLPQVQSLLEKGFSPDLQDERGMNALMWAVKYTQPDMIDFLAPKTSNINARSKKIVQEGLLENKVVQWDQSALEMAVESGNPEVVHRLLSKGAAPNEGLALCYAAKKGNLEIGQLLLSPHAESGLIADVNLGNRGVFTGLPIHIACEGGQQEFVQALLDAGADINDRRSKAGTPLMSAVRKGHLEMVQFLVA
ncbi:MAG: ankyrin repeat domain-containing protein, partial [Cyanobacteria bacterium]|nr:ankyrin repeat domain-containing protein [Cyanobacteriota bacterium]